MTIAGFKAMTEPAKVFEDRETPGQWRVERFDDDGACDLVEIFTGPFARRRALQCAMQKYGHFKEVAVTARSLLEVIGDHRNEPKSEPLPARRA
ncbi:MAG TPA: hypothetical protein VGP42_02190 [Stellaceae bacterium]|jgi:hypothetical protein|nr:hypothetical protein [Stellaceae bacterium]